MIHILYRHTSNVSGVGKNRPKWFSYESCLSNILSTIEGKDNVHFHLLFDGTCTIQDSRIGTVVEFKGGSDRESFNYAWNYAKQLKLGPKDLVYFLENDYLHVNGWVEKVQNLFESFDVPGYVALYDHLDKYTLPMYETLQSQIYVTETSHWRTVPSTCGSFVVNTQILQEDYDVHTTFYSDHDKFIQLGTTRGRVVISPIPGLSTHCESEYMAPLTNWENVNSNTQLQSA